MLTGVAGTLTCTFTITIRKFVSLIISIWYFQNPFTIYHWIGSTAVFIGTAMYSLPQSISKKKTEWNQFLK